MQIWKLSQGALKADETEDLRLRQCVAVTYAVEPGVLKRIADTARDNWDASRRVTGAAISDQERFERAFAQLLANIEESKPGETKVKLLRGYECPVYAGSNGQS